MHSWSPSMFMLSKVLGTLSVMLWITSSHSLWEQWVVWTLWPDHWKRGGGLLHTPQRVNVYVCVWTWAKAQGEKIDLNSALATKFYSDWHMRTRSWQREREGHRRSAVQDYWGRADGITVRLELWLFNDWNVCSIALLKVCISTTEVRRWFVMNPGLLQSPS